MTEQRKEMFWRIITCIVCWRYLVLCHQMKLLTDKVDELSAKIDVELDFISEKRNDNIKRKLDRELDQ